MASAALLLTTASCGEGENALSSGSPATETTAPAEEASDAAVLYQFTEWPSPETTRYLPGQFPSDSEELRDEAAVVVVAELRDVRVTRKAGGQPIVEPGAARADFEVSTVVGGRWRPFESPDLPDAGLITVEIPLSVYAGDESAAVETMESAVGETYLLFLDLVFERNDAGESTPTPAYRIATTPPVLMALVDGTFAELIPGPTPLTLAAIERGQDLEAEEPEGDHEHADGDDEHSESTSSVDAGSSAAHAYIADLIGLTVEGLEAEYQAPTSNEALPGDPADFRVLEPLRGAPTAASGPP